MELCAAGTHFLGDASSSPFYFRPWMVAPIHSELSLLSKLFWKALPQAQRCVPSVILNLVKLAWHQLSLASLVLARECSCGQSPMKALPSAESREHRSPSTWRQSHIQHCEFKANLVYVGISRPARGHIDSVFKKRKKERKTQGFEFLVRFLGKQYLACLTNCCFGIVCILNGILKSGQGIQLSRQCTGLAYQRLWVSSQQILKPGWWQTGL